MKTIFKILLTGLLFQFCTNPTNNKTVEKSYHEIINEELNSGLKYDTIFLDFKLGMSERQVEKCFDNLVKQNRVGEKAKIEIPYLDTKISLFGHVYDFVLGVNNYKTIIQRDFFNDSLYTMTIFIYSGYDITAYGMLINTYKKKYGDFKKDTIDSGNKKTYWINGNREILIAENNIGIAIEYTDTQLRKSKEKLEIIEKEEKRQKMMDKSKQTKSDI